VLVLAVCLHVTSARKHELVLRNEARNFFIVSSFGLLQGGSINVQVANGTVRQQ
jgi:hypothetical protein